MEDIASDSVLELEPSERQADRRLSDSNLPFHPTVVRADLSKT